jgi:CHAD domain-containing protein
VVELRVDESFDVIAAIGGSVWAVDDCEQIERHLDTKRLRMLALGHTLAQVTDARGTRWVMHLAGHDDPIELPADGTEPPPVLVRLMSGIIGERPLIDIATLTWHHRHLAVSIADGEADVMIDDDVVEGDDGVRRRVRVDLLSGDAEQYALAIARLRQAGAESVQACSVLTELLAERMAHTRLRRVRLDVDATLGELAAASITRATRELLALDPALRLDALPDEVHDARVALRRLRSDLRTLEPLVRRRQVEHLRGELEWLAALLGRVRDLDVLADHVHDWLPSTAIDDEGGRLLLRRLRGERRVAAMVLRNALASRRYARLVRDLRRAARRVTWKRGVHAGDAAAEPARHLARRPVRRVERSVDRLDTPPRVTQLHRVRRQAKAARYAAELVSPVLDDELDALAERMHAVQDVLGALQDTVVVHEWVHGLPPSQLAPAEAWAAARLTRAADVAADAARAAWPAAWATVGDAD